MKRIILAILAIAFGGAFVFLIFLLRQNDVQAIGPAGTSIGLATLNQKVFDLLGTSDTLYKITKYAIVIPIGAAAAFAVLGIIEAIKRRSVFKVDREILLLAVLYVAVLIIYIVFEIVKINYRPILLPGETTPETSFPSTHTLLCFSIIGSGMFVLPKYLKSKPLLIASEVVAGVLMVGIVAGRLASGAHWFTDIVGGVIISLALVCGYLSLLQPGKIRD